MIYILTGNIRSGKTTALLDWCKKRDDVDGILCPDNEFGKRFFLKIKNQEMFPLEVDENSSANIISVGNFKFLKSSFLTANEFLISAGNNNISKYLIIDELGKLELQNRGLYDSASQLIDFFELNINQHLILVVRNSLLEEIIEKFNISEYQIISKSELQNLD